MSSQESHGFSHERFKNKCNRDENGLEEAKDKFITHYLSKIALD